MAPLSAPGPTGERQEHLDDCLEGAGVSHRRRLTRCLDDLTVAWATNTLPPTCRWLLNTQAIFLVKDKEPTCKYSDDEAWLQCVPEADVVEVGPEVETGEATRAPRHDRGPGRGRAESALEMERTLRLTGNKREKTRPELFYSTLLALSPPIASRLSM